MIDFLNLALKGDWVIDFGRWIYTTIFLNWTSGLWNWYLSCKEVPGFLHFDVIGSFFLVCLLLFYLWTLGLIFAYLGPWFWTLAAFAALWILKLFFIPVIASMYFSPRSKFISNNKKRLRAIISFSMCPYSFWFLV